MSKYTISFYRGFYVKGDCHCEPRGEKNRVEIYNVDIDESIPLSAINK